MQWFAYLLAHLLLTIENGKNISHLNCTKKLDYFEFDGNNTSGKVGTCSAKEKVSVTKIN